MVVVEKAGGVSPTAGKSGHAGCMYVIDGAATVIACSKTGHGGSWGSGDTQVVMRWGVYEVPGRVRRERGGRTWSGRR